MTDDELKTIRARCDAATPGPWKVGEDKREQAATLHAQPINATTGLPQGEPVGVIIPFGRAYSDARFCAAARADIPQLLDEVQRLRTLNDAWAESARQSLVEMDAAKALTNIANDLISEEP